MNSFQRLLHRHAGTSHEKQRAFASVAATPASFDPDTGKLTFGERQFAAQVLGTVDAGGTWTWAWADPGAYPSELLSAAQLLKRRGVDLGCDPLCGVEQAAADPLQLGYVACGLLDGKALATTEEPQGVVHYLIKAPDLLVPRATGPDLVDTVRSLLEATRLESPRRAVLEYWTQREVRCAREGEDLLGLTTDAQTLEARFNSQGRLTDLTLRPDPPAKGFPLDSLEWSGQDGEATLRLGSVDVAALGRLVAARTVRGLPFSLRGPRGRSLVVQPAKRSGFTLEEKTFGLFLDRAACQDLRATLRPGCGDYALETSLPGLRIAVVVSEIRDPDGKVLREVGWDPLPLPEWAVDAEALHAERARAAAGRARRRRALKLGALALVLFSPVWLFGGASYALRHVPYAIPQAYRAPPPGIGIALGAGLRLRYLGISGYEVTDGKTIVLLDPTLTRPTLPELVSGPVDSDPQLVAQIRAADFILVNHAHHDHALDVPAIAKRTGAVVYGSQSVVNLCLSRGVPAEQARLAVPGERLQLGTFTVDVRTTTHSKVLGLREPMAGTIAPDAGPLWFFGYTNDGMRFYRLEANGSSLWFHPSSTHSPGEFDGPPATTLIMGITGQTVTPALVNQVLDVAKPAWVLPTHYDNFFRPLSDGLGLMPTIDVEAAANLFKQADPDVKVFVLDFDQTVELPAD